MKMKDAIISDCGRYRYRLTRQCGLTTGGCVNFIMLNPSTADAKEDDPTIRRCMSFALRWGFRELVVTNLFAYRATDPREMKKAADPVGPENMQYVQEAADYAVHGWEAYGIKGLVICAWGNHGSYMDQDKTVLGWIGHLNPMALRVSQSGQPAHPLYLPKKLNPQPYEGRR